MKIYHAVEAIDSLEQSSLKKRRTAKKEKKVSAHLQRIEQILDSVFDPTATLIYDLTLQEGQIQAPLTLVIPSGIILFYLDDRRGVFRSRAGEWEQLDERRKRFRALQPNPIREAAAQADALRAYLAGQGFPNVSVQAAIIFTDAGVHIESDQSEVRLVYLDGLPRFAAFLARAQPALSRDEVHNLVTALAPYTLEAAQAAREIQDAFSFREQKPPQIKMPRVEIPLPPDDKVVEAIRKVPFTRRQLLIIAVLVIVNILVLIALILVVLSFS